jgi:hypothetical protein
VLCQGQIRFAPANLIRICHAALKAKDFLLPGNTVCAFLMVDSGMGYKTTGWSEEDTVHHILTQFPLAKQVWFRYFEKL